MKNTGIAMILTAALVFIATGPAFAQIPTALRSTTNQKLASGGRFGTDIDNFMGTRDWPGMVFDKHFFFIGGRYQGTVVPALGYAAKLGRFYLGTYFRGTVVQGDNTHHNNPWDSVWDKDGNGTEKFYLNDALAILFGAPGIGGFRFEWIAANADGSSGPAFEKFKGNDRQINGQSVQAAQGTADGSMSFVLHYGNKFIWGEKFYQQLKTDAAVGFASPPPKALTWTTASSTPSVKSGSKTSAPSPPA